MPLNKETNQTLPYNNLTTKPYKTLPPIGIFLNSFVNSSIRCLFHFV